MLFRKRFVGWRWLKRELTKHKEGKSNGMLWGGKMVT